MNRRKVKKLEERIKDLKERIAMNTWDIEEGEPSSFKKYSRSDNVCCKKWLKEAEKELTTLNLKFPNSHQNKNTEPSQPMGTSGIRNRDTNGITGSGDNNYSHNHGKEKA